jgi:hypothetical protein
MHQLEQQEKAAHFTLLAEGQNCIKLDLKVRSAQEELLKRLQCLAELSTDFKNVVIYFYSFVIYHVGFLHKIKLSAGVKE